MSLSLAKLFFFPSLIISIFFSLSAPSIILAWVGLEMNMISVIPLLSMSNLSFGGEISMKYFLTQAWASSLFIMGVFMSQLSSTFWLLMEGALLMKLGAGPLHLWFISIMRKCSFESFFILSTLQKLIPLFIFQSMTNSIFANISIVLSILVSGMGVFNHGSLRLVLAYSSIFTVAWCLSGTKMFSFSWLAYLFVYSISLLVVILWMEKDQITNLSQLYSRNMTMMASTVFFLGMASLGGLPPLTGFWVKLVILLGLLSANMLTISAILLIGTIWILYLYMRMSFLSGGQGSTSGIWFPTMNNDSLYFGLVIIIFLPMLMLIGLFLLGGVTHKILIFKILE